MTKLSRQRIPLLVLGGKSFRQCDVILFGQIVLIEVISYRTELGLFAVVVGFDQFGAED